MKIFENNSSEVVIGTVRKEMTAVKIIDEFVRKNIVSITVESEMIFPEI